MSCALPICFSKHATKVNNVFGMTKGMGKIIVERLFMTKLECLSVISFSYSLGEIVGYCFIFISYIHW